MTTPDPAAGPSLDCRGDRWHAVFPGLGQCWVDADGSVRVEVEAPGADDTDSVEQRQDALRHGWAEPLSWRRRGVDLAQAAAYVPPGTDLGLLVIESARGTSQTRLRHELAGRGWELLAESPAPYDTSGEVIRLLPREAPFLGARRAPDERWGSRPARGDSDAVVVQWPRRTTAVRLGGIVELRSPHARLPAVEPVTGRAKVPLVARVEGAGLWRWAPDLPADHVLADHVARLRLVAVPAASLALEEDGGGVSEVAVRLEQWVAEAVR